MRLDPFLLALFASVIFASIWPMAGTTAAILSLIVNLAIALLFFLHGAKISRSAVMAGLTNIRLQSLALAMSFLIFPAVGLTLKFAMPDILPQPLWWGVVFLCLLPSTIQSAPAFVAMARGEVAAALCAATISNVLGIFLTPLLVALLMTKGAAHIDSGRVLQVVVQLLLPFIIGQLCHAKLGGWLKDRARVITFYDRSVIILAVYSAFSAAMNSHVWERLSPAVLGTLLTILLLILALMWLSARLLARAAGFAPAQAVVLLYGGTQKSLASGIPMANVLFAPAVAGLVVLPLMLFHQMQLLAASLTAGKYGNKDSKAGETP